MSDGVLATDRSGKIIMINETARKQLNLTKEQALEKNITDLLEGDTPIPIVNWFPKRLL